MLLSVVYVLQLSLTKTAQVHSSPLGESCASNNAELRSAPWILTFYTYRVIQEESALLWEMVVWVILSKKVQMNMGPILNGYGVMGIF